MTQKPKILVLDDQMLIAFEVAAVLENHGFDVVGPFSNVTTAMSSVTQTPPDAAILDINMGDGTTSEALADALIEKNLPFIFLSGYGSAGIMPDRFEHIDQLAKPFQNERLLSAMSKLTARSA